MLAVRSPLEAVQVGLQDVDDYEAVIKCRLTALRRRSGAGAPALAADAVAAMKLVIAYFPEAITLHLSLCKHWATCAAVDPAGACACWEERLSQCSMAQLWPAYREYIEWRTNSGAIEDARRLFEELLNRERKRALPAAAALECAEAHLAFERAHGTAEQELVALNLARRARSRAAAAPVAAAAGVPKEGAPSKKRPAEAGPVDGAKPKAKKGKKVQVGAKQQESKPQGGGQGGKGGRTYNDENTVFVKHLSPDVTEEHLREKFAVRTLRHMQADQLRPALQHRCADVIRCHRSSDALGQGRDGLQRHVHKCALRCRLRPRSGSSSSRVVQARGVRSCNLAAVTTPLLPSRSTTRSYGTASTSLLRSRCRLASGRKASKRPRERHTKVPGTRASLRRARRVTRARRTTRRKWRSIRINGSVLQQ